MSYTDVGDDELIYLIKSDNQEAWNYLIKRYRKRIFGMINSFSKKYLIKGLDYEDYFHNCFIVFLKCIDNYDEDYNFYNYICQSIERELHRLINKELMAREILPLDDELVIKDKVLIDEISDGSLIYKGKEIEETLILKDDLFSKVVLNYRLRGYSCLEIASLLNVSKKKVYKQINEFKEILKKKSEE